MGCRARGRVWLQMLSVCSGPLLTPCSPPCPLPTRPLLSPVPSSYPSLPPLPLPLCPLPTLSSLLFLFPFQHSDTYLVPFSSFRLWSPNLFYLACPPRPPCPPTRDHFPQPGRGTCRDVPHPLTLTHSLTHSLTQSISPSVCESVTLTLGYLVDLGPSA